MARPDDKSQGWRRALLLISEAVVVVYVVLDALVTPVFRPLIRWTAQLRVIARLQAAVARLPPYGVLVALAIPFAVAEPAKIYAVILIGTGHVIVGVSALVLAYAVSLLIIERIYDAGKAKLMTIEWFAKILNWLIAFRDRIIAWAKSTEAWAYGVALGRKARALTARIKLRIGWG
ncbi:hypothetical protein [Methylocapsa palsarum]|uniref:Uncharacterized protein n=1 Tax=Methylocapsa palsarum TaxID=1612308 RepID=A0A1I3WRJ4_9HYPH|nr:hypothetical protein [Methylocapsa palsarum]SFK09086.1 hypothetical protein SAMN05444581_10221 [Methylocapsa palsarum]